MKNTLILTILLFNTLVGYAQQPTAPTDKEASTLAMMKSGLYINKSLFTPMQEGLGEPKPDEEMPWAPQKAAMKLADILARMAENQEVESKARFGRTQLCIKARLPEDLAPNTYLLKCTLKSADVKDANGNPVTLKPKVDINSGGGSSSNLRDGVMVTEDYSIVTVCFNPETGTTPALPLTGTLNLEYSYEGTFETLQITAASKGKALPFGGNTIKVLDIDKNIALLDVAGPKTSFMTANLNKEGQLMGRNFDVAYQGDPMSMGSSRAVMDKAVYDVFKANPTISEDAFGEAIHAHLLSKIRNPKTPKPTVTVCRELSPIGTLVLYRPKPAQIQAVKVAF